MPLFAFVEQLEAWTSPLATCRLVLPMLFTLGKPPQAQVLHIVRMPPLLLFVLNEKPCADVFRRFYGQPPP